MNSAKINGNSALPSRPHSAFIPRSPLSVSKKATSPLINQTDASNSSSVPSQDVEETSRPLPPTRRRSDFVTKYEFLMNKAQKALQVVDKIETVATM